MLNIKEWTPQDIAMSVWASAKNNEYSDDFFESVTNHIIGMTDLSTFGAQQLSMILWSYATADITHPLLFDKIAEHIVQLPNLNKFAPQSISNILWAYAKRGYHTESLFEKVADHIVGQNVLLLEYNESLSMIIWSFAKAQSNHPGLFEMLTNHILSLDTLDDFPFKSLFSIVGGVSKFCAPPRELLEKVIKAVGEVEPIELARLSMLMFPDQEDIFRFDDAKMMKLLLRLRLNRNYKEDGVYNVYVCVFALCMV